MTTTTTTVHDTVDTVPTSSALELFVVWSSYDWDQLANHDDPFDLRKAAESTDIWSLFSEDDNNNHNDEGSKSTGSGTGSQTSSSPPSAASVRKRRRTLDRMFQDVEWDAVANSLREEQAPSSMLGGRATQNKNKVWRQQQSQQQLQPPTPPPLLVADESYALSFRHADRLAHEVCRLQNATRMSIYDELFWLVFIAVRGQAEFERVTAPGGVLPPARYLTAQKIAIQQQQSMHPRRTVVDTQVSASFMSGQLSANSCRQVRMFLKLWCRHNLSIVLQWYADFFGRPIAFVHRGKGWCVEVLPTPARPVSAIKAAATATALETDHGTIMRAHRWTPAANTVVLYLYDYTPMAQFGVDLTPKRVPTLPWAQHLVRLHSFDRPMSKVDMYHYADLRMLADRMMRAATDGGGGDSGQNDPIEADDGTKKASSKLYATLATAWMIF